MGEAAPHENPHAWRTMQIAECLRDADALLLPALALLREVAPGHVEELQVRLDEGEVRELCAIAESLAELSEHLRRLSEQLPRAEVAVTAADVAEGAVADIAHGIVDPVRLALAARVVPAARGWLALAHALRTADTHAAWGEITLGDLLSSFRGADEQLVQFVLAVAGTSAGIEARSCDPGVLARLAEVLEQHAPTEAC